MILSNVDIYKINEKLKIPNLLVINKDELKNININNNKNNYIINIDKIDGKGTHWVSIFNDIYFDSFSLKPANIIEDYFKNGYYMNDKQIQHIKHNYCGWICLMFLYYMNNNNNNNNYPIFYKFLKLFNYKNLNKNKDIVLEFFYKLF